MLYVALWGQQSDAAQTISELHQNEILPLINTILTVVIVIAVAWCVVMFFMGKKQALTVGGFILLGAIIFKVFPKIIQSIMGI